MTLPEPNSPGSGLISSSWAILPVSWYILPVSWPYYPYPETVTTGSYPEAAGRSETVRTLLVRLLVLLVHRWALVVHPWYYTLVLPLVLHPGTTPGTPTLATLYQHGPPGYWLCTVLNA